MLALIGRTEIEISDDFSSQAPAVRNCRIEASDRDGAIHVAHRRLAAGEIGRGVSDAELEAKFHRLAAALPREGREALLDALWHLDTLDDVGRLVDRLAL